MPKMAKIAKMPKTLKMLRMSRIVFQKMLKLLKNIVTFCFTQKGDFLGKYQNKWELRWWNYHHIWWKFVWQLCHFLFHSKRWFFWELPELVIIKVMKLSPYLVTICVTIMSFFASPIVVIFPGFCRNWWEIKWWKDHRNRWQIVQTFCHNFLHPLWWFFGCFTKIF